MGESPQTALSVALLAEGAQRSQLRALLQRQGVRITREDSFPVAGFPFDGGEEDVFLVGLGERFDESVVCRFLEQVQSPVLFNQGGVGCSQVWKRQFIDKLHQLASREPGLQAGQAGNPRPGLHLVGLSTPGRAAAHHLVVLGASIGGPRAISCFLQSLPQPLPVTFLLAQPIASSYQHLLAEQLNRCSSWMVSSLQCSQQMLPGQVWLIPPGQGISLSHDGNIRLRNLGGAGEAGISTLMETVAQTFGARSGAIVFSGLGKDGQTGCETIMKHGGFVWTQDRGSCVNASLPDAVHRTCQVEYSGTPEELAKALSEKYRAKADILNPQLSC